MSSNSPASSGPLMRSVELLETHFERGVGVLAAVRARLARRVLPRLTQDGLVEYGLPIPPAAQAARAAEGAVANGLSYGQDIDWILSGRNKTPFLLFFFAVSFCVRKGKK